MKQRTNTGRGAQAGFSLVELMVVASLLTLVIGSILMVGGAGDRAYRTGSTTANLEAQAAMTIERIVPELRIAMLASIDPDPLQGVGSDAIEYLQATGLSGGAIESSALRRLSFEHETGEVDDGIDNNGNGLVDEGCVVLVDDVGGASERRIVLTHWVRELLEGEQENGVDDNGNGLVDERGFFVERIGETLVVRLTLQRTDSEGRLLTRTAQTSTRVRN